MLRHGRVEEGFQKRSVHLLQHAVIKHPWFELGERLRLKEIEVLRRENGWNQVCSLHQIDFKLRLCKQDCFGSQRFAGPCTPDPGNGVLAHGW